MNSTYEYVHHSKFPSNLSVPEREYTHQHHVGALKNNAQEHEEAHDSTGTRDVAVRRRMQYRAQPRRVDTGQIATESINKEHKYSNLWMCHNC